MQLSSQPSAAVSATAFVAEEASAATPSRYSEYKIIRRNGAVVGFEPSKIAIAVTKAFLAINGGQGAASARVRELVTNLTETVVSALMRRQPNGGTFHIEDIQDQVELALMRSGEHEVARAYVLYREQRSQERAKQREMLPQSLQAHPVINVTENGKTHPLDMVRLSALVHEACEGLGRAVDPEKILQATLKEAEYQAARVRASHHRAPQSSGVAADGVGGLVTAPQRCHESASLPAARPDYVQREP